MDAGILLWSALRPVIKIVLISFSGAILGHKRVNLFPAAVRKAVSKIIFNLLLPCLVFQNLGAKLDVSSLLSGWGFVLHIAVNVLCGAFLGYILARIFRVNFRLRRVIMVCLSVGNLGMFPLVLVDTFCTMSGSPFVESYLNGSNSTDAVTLASEECLGDGFTYVSITMTVGIMLNWVYAYKMMEGARRREDDALSRDRSSLPSVRLLPVEDDESLSGESEENEEGKEAERFDEREAGSTELKEISLKELSLQRSNGIEEKCTKRRSMGRASDEEDRSEEQAEQQSAMFGVTEQPEKVAMHTAKGKSRCERCALPKRCSIQWKHIVTPPIIAIVLSLIVGLVPPVNALFFSPSAPLEVVTSVIITMGNACIPLNLLILGGNLSEGPAKGGLMRWPMVLSVTVSKLIVLPLVGLGFSQLLNVALGNPLVGPSLLGIGGREAPLWIMVALVIHTVPSAVNIATLTTLLGFAEKEASTLLFWQYITCFLSIAAFLILYLFLIFS